MSKLDAIIDNAVRKTIAIGKRNKAHWVKVRTGYPPIYAQWNDTLSRMAKQGFTQLVHDEYHMTKPMWNSTGAKAVRELSEKIK